MDCTTVSDRVAAYLDAELSRSERELFEAHLEGCLGCQALVERVSAVDLRPPPAPVEVEAPGFWDRMDRALAAEIDSMAAAAPPPKLSFPQRLWRWEIRVSLPVVVAYAAFLLLAVGWSLSNLERAQAAETAAVELAQQLEREQRQQTAPPQVVRSENTTRASIKTVRPRF